MSLPNLLKTSCNKIFRHWHEPTYCRPVADTTPVFSWRRFTARDGGGRNCFIVPNLCPQCVGVWSFRHLTEPAGTGGIQRQKSGSTNDHTCVFASGHSGEWELWSGRDPLIEDFLFPFFGDECLESSDDLVAPGHDGIHFGLGQIVFGFCR